MNDRSLHYRTCPLCEATCGLEVTVEGDALDGKVVRIRGDRDDVFSHGFICPKGSTLKQLHEDPDRLTLPMVKRDGRHVEVSWDEAFEEIERLMLPVIEEHGRESVAIYQGNPAVHNHALTIYGRALISALGTRNIYSAGTVDQMPRHVSSGFLYGDPLAFPVPDLDRTDYLLMLGANPFESNGSLATAPDFPGRLQAIQKRGGRFVVVDPRRTKTAKAADEHLTIRPGSDAAWLAALAHVLFDEDLVDAGAAGEHLDGGRRRASTGRAVHARSGRARDLDHSRDHSSHRPRTRGSTHRGGLRADRHQHGAVRNPGLVADRRGHHPDRQPRPAGRHDVGPPGTPSTP